MNYNIEKINEISKNLAEVIEETVSQTEEERYRIGNVEMAWERPYKPMGFVLVYTLPTMTSSDMISNGKNSTPCTSRPG